MSSDSSHSSHNAPPESEDLRPAIRLAAMDLLARREHSRRELVQKLGRRFSNKARSRSEAAFVSEARDAGDTGDEEEPAAITGVIAEVVDGLTQENLQSDSRYAESFARQRMLRGYGPMRLRQEMRQKGIADDEAGLALDALDVDWEQLAIEVCRKKFGTADPADLKEKSRRQRFLQYRGFGSEHIAACLPR